MKISSLPLSYYLFQSKQTEQFGERLANLCQEPCVLFLQGVLGAGKTTFSRGFIKQLSNTKQVKSPTYTLLEYYTTPILPIVHIDCYRLKTAAELEAIGIRDYMQNSAIWLIEWPEKVARKDGFSLLPKPDLMLYFKLLANNHQLTLEATTQVGDKLINELGNSA